jgi:hypothetical protein
MGQKSVKKDWCATAGFLSLDAAHIHIQFPHKIFRYFGLSLILALLRLFGWKEIPGILEYALTTKIHYAIMPQ